MLRKSNNWLLYILVSDAKYMPKFILNCTHDTQKKFATV